jgi:hypothetical protein
MVNRIKKINKVEGGREMIFDNGHSVVVPPKGSTAKKRKEFGKALFNTFELYSPDELVEAVNRKLGGEDQIDLPSMFAKRDGDKITLLELLMARITYDAVVEGKSADKDRLLHYMFNKPVTVERQEKPEEENLDAIKEMTPEQQTKVIQMMSKYELKDIADAMKILDSEKEIES